MKYRNISGTDLSISEVSFGCMSLPTGNDKANKYLLHQAIDSGINLFDTADLYDHGDNEVIVGKALKSYRNKVYIATKVGNRWKKDLSGWDWVPKKDYIIEAVEKSLKRLKTDYIDLYQLHGGTIEDNFEEVFETFEQLKEQGKIRHYGISSIRPIVVRKVIPKYALTSVMVQYSLLDRRPEKFILPYLQEHNRGILVRGSLAKGLLINKEPTEYLDHSPADVLNLQKLNNILGHPISNALNFVLTNQAISSTVVGMSTLKQLEEVIFAYHNIDFQLPDDFLNELPVYNYKNQA